MDDEHVSGQDWTIRVRRDEDEWVEQAQTMGMSAGGLPEFSIGALPYEKDPYAEMEFGAEGMSHVLDQVIAAWRASPVRAGHPIEVEAYPGWNILVDPVSDSPTSDDTGARVIRLQWKLAPAPPPEPVDVGSEFAIELRLGIIALEARTPDAIAMRGLERDDAMSFDHDQRFGPLTPWVVANARAMLALENLDQLAVRVEDAAMAENPEIHEVALDMVAKMVLRDDAARRLQSISRRLSHRLQTRDDWTDEIRHRAQELDFSRTWTRTYLGNLLDRFVRNTLLACALQDVIGEQLLLSTLGAWNTVLSPDGAYTGDRWRCSDATSSTLRAYFADMDEDDLVAAVATLDDSSRSRDAELGFKLIGSTLVRKASPPPLAEIVGPGLRDLLEYRGGRSHLDQIARLIAALCEPPSWLEATEVESQRSRLTDLLGVAW